MNANVIATCTRRYASLLGLAVFACGPLAACGGTDTILNTGSPLDPGSSQSPGTLPGQGTSPSITTTNAIVSECGGFATPKKSALAKRLTSEGIQADAGTNQCVPETLAWAYDPQTQKLTLQDLHVVLNCCGQRGIAASYGSSANELVITETDSPGTDRCLCMCLYDFAIDILSVAGSPVDVTLVRHVTDSGDAATVWTGTLDLSAGTGTIPLATEPPPAVACAIK